MFKRTQNRRNSSSTYTDSSSDQELIPRNKKLLPNLGFPVSISGKACSKRKSTTKNRFRASQKKSTRASAGMHDLEKFWKSLIKDLKFERKKMFAQFKKDLRNVTAVSSTVNTTNNRGRHIPNTNQASLQLNPHSVFSVQGTPSTRNSILPEGRQIQGSVCARNTQFNPRGESSLINAVNRSGYSFNVLAQSSNQNASAMGYGNLSHLYRNNIHTSGMVPGFQLTLEQRLGNTFHIPNQNLAGNSSRSAGTLGWNMNRGPMTFSGSSPAVSNNVATNHFRANGSYTNVNLGADEAWLQTYGPHNGYFQ